MLSIVVCCDPELGDTKHESNLRAAAVDLHRLAPAPSSALRVHSLVAAVCVKNSVAAREVNLKGVAAEYALIIAGTER